MKEKKNPMSAWAIPFVTGHKYRIYWDKGQLNWTRMRVEVSQMWKPTDKEILFNYPYTDSYEFVDFFATYNSAYKDETDTNFYKGTTLDPAT